MATNEELKSRLNKRMKIGVFVLLLVGVFSTYLYFLNLYRYEKARADFWATFDFSYITDSDRTAEERIQAIYWIAEAAEKNPFGLIGESLPKFELFEKNLLTELRMISLLDTVPGMIFIPEGNFLFGGIGKFTGEPQDTSLTAFYIDKYPVTNQEFCQFLNDSGNHQEEGSFWYKARFGHIDSTADGFRIRSGFENHPVVSVSWYGARAYARWVGKRLPTEFEWEKAARGIYGRLYPWGSIFDWKKCNSASFWAKREIFAAERDDWYENGGFRIGDTTPVNQFSENVSPYGCRDMCGNVWEWTLTRGERLIRKEPRYINRGGAFSYGVEQVRIPFRGRGHPGATGSITGFRCASDAAITSTK